MNLISKRNHRVGFTLVELLVVIAIIGILVALLLPAVQSAREAARRLQCKNNLKQIGLALHTYHTAHSQFPPGGVVSQSIQKGTPCFNNQEEATYAPWTVAILPQLEQQNVYDKLDLTKPMASSDQRDATRQHPDNFFAYSLPMPLFRCPSHPGARALNGGGTKAYTPSYLGVMGGARTPTNVSPVPSMNDVFHCTGSSTTGRGLSVNGVLIPNGAVNISDIRDGTTNTLAVGESRYVVYNGTGVNEGRNFSWASSINADKGYVMGSVLATVVDSINLIPEGATGNPYDDMTRGFSSYHTGGANFVLADGSVHYVSDSVDLRLHQSTGTRADGLPVGSPF